MSLMRFIKMDKDGAEVDWIDPVLDFKETETHWIVDNGYEVYEVPRGEGSSYKIEALDAGDNPYRKEQ